MHPFTSIRRIRRPSPATAIACLALFVALGGTAMAAGAIITSNAQVGPQTNAGGRDGLALSGNTDNIIDGSIVSADLGRKSVTEDKLIGAIAGPRASGDVKADGTLVQANGQPFVTRQAVGDYCVSVPGRSPVTSSIIVSPDHQFDTTIGSGQTLPHSAVVEADGACAGLLGDNHGFRVRTFDETGGGAMSIFSHSEGFTFIVN